MNLACLFNERLYWCIFVKVAKTAIKHSKYLASDGVFAKFLWNNTARSIFTVLL